MSGRDAIDGIRLKIRRFMLFEFRQLHSHGRIAPQRTVTHGKIENLLQRHVRLTYTTGRDALQLHEVDPLLDV
jgi:hypothetical protein